MGSAPTTALKKDYPSLPAPPSPAAHLGLVLNWDVKLEFSRKLVLRVESVREVNSTDATVCVDLKSQGNREEAAAALKLAPFHPQPAQSQTQFVVSRPRQTDIYSVIKLHLRSGFLQKQQYHESCILHCELLSLA